jgi:hypothetical protein
MDSLETFIHLNAHHMLGDTSLDIYFSHFTNKNCHNLNPGTPLPAAAEFLLGFGLKLILIQKKTFNQMILMMALIALTVTCF